MKKNLSLFAFAGMVILILTSGIQDPQGKFGYTGSPGETTCYAGGCHSSYPLNSGSGTLLITSNIPNWEYTPGQTYQISIMLNYTGRTLFGFDVECLDSSNHNLGSLVAGSDSHLGFRNVSGVTRTSVSHKTNGGASTDTHTFNFTWTAPAAGSGDGTFYFAGNCANHNGNQLGDYIYSGTQSVTEYIAPSAVTDIVSHPLQLSVFPMPAHSNLNLNYSLPSAAEVAITLFTLDGTQVTQPLATMQDEGSHTATLDVSGMSKGIYLLQVLSGSTREIRKIAIQ